MIDVLLVIVPLFLIILLGALLERMKIASEQWSTVLNAFALKIGFPALIFSALANADFSFYEQKGLILANSALLLSTFVVAYLFGKTFKLSSKNFRTLFICLGFGNAAYLGIPTLIQIFGEAILPIASLIVAVYLFWMFTVGIGFLDYSKQSNKSHVFRKILINLTKNPLLIAVFLGLLVTGLNIPIPGMLNKSISMISASVTPVVLIVIGLFIGKSKIGELKKWTPVFIFSLVKIMLIPALFFLGIKLFGFSPADFSASIIEAAMPLAITPFALADIYKLNKGLIARSIVMSTILSVISIPFWISVL